MPGSIQEYAIFQVESKPNREKTVCLRVLSCPNRAQFTVAATVSSPVFRVGKKSRVEDVTWSEGGQTGIFKPWG